MKKIINSDKAPAPIGPYNHSVLTGNLLFISGQIPFNQATETLVTTGIADEAKQVMANLEAILTEAEMTFDNVVKATIFLTDMDNFSIVNEIYGSHFNADNAPARECVQVVKLPRNVNVEISMIASK
ncbi:MAG: Rid family detoxifying hydrolase [Flavobacteriaceae bacterium]|jgi:2-iminobutanoate/2-iminopropanoate deaminase|nr:Rid family detoxifying hydrolase [Flavobacteriaceae bacterium]